MKTIAPLLLLPFLASPALAGSGLRDLTATAARDGRFETLVAALRQTGLDEVLRGPGPFTVFAPTDEAFAALPAGTLATLLRPENRDALTRLLKQHVVAGRVMAGDLLATTGVRTLAGSQQPIGLRVGRATVIQADVACTNGVIHVVDRVLVGAASAQRPAAAPTLDVASTLRAALDRGVPAYNAGDVEACARIYRQAAERLVAHGGDALGAMQRMDLESVLAAPGKTAKERAWNLRHAFDRILLDEDFEPVREAELPAGFPAPGPVGHVVVKRYPRYRAARAEGGNPFWTLFRHIKSNGVEMTAPVEMTMDAGMHPKDMAFLYPSPTQGDAGTHGKVDVVDLRPTVVASIGVRGRREATLVERARKALEGYLAEHGLEAAGPYRLLGYNSPMVPAARQYWELQVPVRGGS